MEIEELKKILICASCGKPATCFGAYEGGQEQYACDDCCGHGNEDGWCNPVSNEPQEKVAIKLRMIPVSYGGTIGTPTAPVADQTIPIEQFNRAITVQAWILHRWENVQDAANYLSQVRAWLLKHRPGSEIEHIEGAVAYYTKRKTGSAPPNSVAVSGE